MKGAELIIHECVVYNSYLKWTEKNVAVFYFVVMFKEINYCQRVDVHFYHNEYTLSWFIAFHDSL